jgi:AsmA protein
VSALSTHDPARPSLLQDVVAIIWKHPQIAYNTRAKDSTVPETVSTPSLALPTWSYKLKKAAWIGLGIIGFLVALILIGPHFVDLGLFKRTYLPLVEEALNRRLDVGEVRLSLVPTPSIRLSNLKVFDPPAFAENTFFSAEQVRLRLKLWPLLKGRFEVTELLLDKPVFNLLKQPDGTFNYSDIATKKPPAGTRRETRKKSEAAKPAEMATVPVLIPQNVSIKDGQINLLTQGRALVNIKGIDLSLKEFSSDAPFPFKASFNYPGLRTISLEGELDYQEEKSLLELKNNHLKIQDLSLPVQGGVSNPFTAPRVNLNLKSDNVDAGKIFQILSVFSLAPRDTEISGPMSLDLNVNGPANSLVTQVRGLFKDVKVKGKRAVKGNFSGEVSMRLPPGGGSVSKRLQGNGKLVARDGELTNVDLINKIERVTGMIGLSKDERRQATTFKTLEADFILGGGYAEFRRLYLINPQMEVSGNGTMTLEQPTLDLALSTALSPQASARTTRAKISTFFRDKQGRVVVPLKVSGPVENPSVNLNAGKLVEAGLPQNAEKGFSAFFKRLFRSR